MVTVVTVLSFWGYLFVPKKPSPKPVGSVKPSSIQQQPGGAPQRGAAEFLVSLSQKQRRFGDHVCEASVGRFLQRPKGRKKT